MSNADKPVFDLLIYKRVQAVYVVPNTLSEYIAAVCDGRDWLSGLVPPDSEEFYIAVAELFRGRLCRKKKIRKTFSVLLSTNYLDACVLRFKPYFKVKAYMTDDGHVYFSSAHVRKTNGATLIKLLLHEAAHLWLSRQKGYVRLKQLDKAFRARYGASAPALAPVEYYAIALSVKMLERLLPLATGNTKKDVLSQIEREVSKLTDTGAVTDDPKGG